MPKGGARPGAGRKKGGTNNLSASSTNRAIRERVYAEAERGVLTPIEVVISAMHDAWDNGTAEGKALAVQYARLAAPYIHPRLSTVNATATVEHKSDGEDNVRRLAMFMMAALRSAKEKGVFVISAYGSDWVD